MKLNTIIFGLGATIIIPIIGAMFGVDIAIYVIAALCIFKGVAMLVKPEVYKKVSDFINPTRKEALVGKSSEFRQHVSQEPIGSIITGIILAAGAFRVTSLNLVGMKYLIALALIVFIYIFGETYSMMKANTYEDYKKTRNYRAFALLTIVIIIIKL